MCHEGFLLTAHTVSATHLQTDSYDGTAMEKKMGTVKIHKITSFFFFSSVDSLFLFVSVF